MRCLIEAFGKLLRSEWVEMAPHTSDTAVPDRVPETLLPHATSSAGSSQSGT